MTMTRPEWPKVVLLYEQDEAIDKYRCKECGSSRYAKGALGLLLNLRSDKCINPECKNFDEREEQ